METLGANGKSDLSLYSCEYAIDLIPEKGESLKDIYGIPFIIPYLKIVSTWDSTTYYGRRLRRWKERSKREKDYSEKQVAKYIRVGTGYDYDDRSWKEDPWGEGDRVRIEWKVNNARLKILYKKKRMVGIEEFLKDCKIAEKCKFKIASKQRKKIRKLKTKLLQGEWEEEIERKIKEEIINFNEKWKKY